MHNLLHNLLFDIAATIISAICIIGTFYYAIRSAYLDIKQERQERDQCCRSRRLWIFRMKSALRIAEEFNRDTSEIRNNVMLQLQSEKESNNINRILLIAFTPFAFATILYILSYPLSVLLLPSGFLMIFAVVWFAICLVVYWLKRKAFISKYAL